MAQFNRSGSASLISEDIDVLARLAVAGGGITRLFAFVAEPYLAHSYENYSRPELPPEENLEVVY